jgi:hypothetical protein
MIVELYPLDDYSERMRIMVHVNPNEWKHLYCFHGLTFPGFRLHQHETTRFLVIPRGRTKVTSEHVYECLRREFARANLMGEHFYAEKRQARLPRNVPLHANVKRVKERA